MDLRPLLLPALLFASTAHAAIPAGARADIAKVNADWSTAMMKGDAAAVAAAYAKGAVFCDATGQCITGHDAILGMTAQRFKERGLPKRAAAHTTAMVEDRGYVYEWGKAELVSASGEAAGGGYLTVWQQQPDGHWLIVRNLVLP
jgi:uncharacterized protein (TIGR02246 family)